MKKSCDQSCIGIVSCESEEERESKRQKREGESKKLPAPLWLNNSKVLEGPRVDSWRSGDLIAWTSRIFIDFVLACYVGFEHMLWLNFI